MTFKDAGSVAGGNNQLALLQGCSLPSSGVTSNSRVSHRTMMGVTMASAALAAGCSAVPDRDDEAVTGTREAIVFESDSILNDDGRMNLRSVMDPKIRKLAESAAIIVERQTGLDAYPSVCRDDLAVEGECLLNDSPMTAGTSTANGHNLCTHQAFSAEQTLNYGQTQSGGVVLGVRTCTGVLVGDDLMLTAGHCIQPDASSESDATDLFMPHCKDVDIVFNHHGDGSISKGDVYQCKTVVARTSPAPTNPNSVGIGRDWTLFQLDRKVTGRHRMRLQQSRTPAVGDSVIHMGHGLGLPLKVNLTGDGLSEPMPVLKEVESGCTPTTQDLCMVQTNVDAFHGDSGSPLIDLETGRVVALVAAGPKPNFATPQGSDEDGACNVYATCPSGGCDPSDLDFERRWIQAASVLSIDPGLVPLNSSPDLRISADFDADGALDLLRLEETQGTGQGYFLIVEFGDTSKPDFELPTGVSSNDLPAGFDTALAVTVRDFDNDGYADILLQFDGFAPFYYDGASGLIAPTLNPMPLVTTYAGFSSHFGNHDEFADVGGIDPFNERIDGYLGSDTGLMRTVPMPDGCNADEGGDALAILPAGILDPLSPVAVIDCDADTESDQVSFISLLTNQELQRATLEPSTNWRGFAYRPEQGDVLAVGDTVDGFAVYSIDPITLETTELFSETLSEFIEHASGVAWDAETSTIRVVTDITEGFDYGGRVFTHDTAFARIDDYMVCGGLDGAVLGNIYVNGILAEQGGIFVDCAVRVNGQINRLYGYEGLGDGEPLTPGLTFLDFADYGSFTGDAIRDMACDPLLPVMWIRTRRGGLFGKFVGPYGLCAPQSPFFSRLPAMDSGAWTMGGTPLPTADGALIVEASGYVQVNSPTFSTSTLSGVGTHLSLDVFVPPDVSGQQDWAGDIQLFGAIPSENNHQGYAPLTSLRRGQWSTLTFELNASLYDALAGDPDSDLSLTLAVNRPAGSNPIRLRSLHFSGQVERRAANCADGLQNQDEADVDCGGSCGSSCGTGEACSSNGDCASGTCEAGTCAGTGGGCSAASATDLGAPGHSATVSNAGCLRVSDAYPSWWGSSRNMLLQAQGGGTYPVPFTWSNACASAGGSAVFGANWQQQVIGPTSAQCPTLIDLQGAGDGTVTLTYYGN